MRKLLILLGIACMVGLSGCSENPTTSNGTGGVEPLASSVPADIQNLLELYDDPGAVTAEADSPFPENSSGEYDVYAVTFLWGQLGNVPPAEAAPTDWSGSLSSNAVASVNVRFLIDFELGQDSLLPVSTPATVEWVSATGFDIDGISFRVSVERGIMYFAPPELIFDTAPITLRLPFRQLEHFIAYYPLADGQGVAVLARRLWSNSCPSGALRGKWSWHDNTNSNGVIDGLWLDDDGNPIGVYSGEFWTNNDGTHAFRGWISGLTTLQIVAEFKGRWWFDDPRMCPMCGDDHGVFCGKVRWLEDNSTGFMSGHFGDWTDAVDAAVLPMIGVWKKICPSAHVNSTDLVGN